MDVDCSKMMFSKQNANHGRSFYILKICLIPATSSSAVRNTYSVEKVTLRATKSTMRNSKINCHSWDPTKTIEWLQVRDSWPFVATLIAKDKNDSSEVVSSDVHEVAGKVFYCPSIVCMDGYSLSKLSRLLNFDNGPLILYETLLLNQRFASHRRTEKELTMPFSYFDSSNLSIIVYSVIISLKPPNRHVMDVMGARLSNTFLHERQDVDSALSWLSTLGGAFSCLGETSKSWALSAGENSLKQLQLAIRLNDPLITSRCKIYLALSLIQRGYLRSARQIVESQYAFYRSLPSGTDTRLGKMCQGVWHRLKYEWGRKRQLKQLQRSNVSIRKL